MRKVLLALLTLVPLAVATPQASAAPNATWAGACHYEGNLVYVAMVLYQPANPADVVGGTVYCHLYYRENGWLGEHLATYSFYGPGPVFGVAPDRIDLNGKDFFVCHTIYYDNGEMDGRHCDGGSVSYSVVGDAFDLSDQVYGQVYELSAIPDPVLCPILAAQAPGIPGAVDVTPAGDVFVAGETVWDCPPYA